MTENMTEALEKAAAVTIDNLTPEKTLVPLFDRVLVEPIAEATHELMVDEITGSEPTRGTVIAAGRECEFSWEIGDEVLFKKYQADEIDDGALLIFQERNLLGVWR